MDEIALLQQQLAAVQQQESALKLSDHNVIDLLLKLQHLGKLQVVHTRSGKQFLTPAQIEREVADYVALHAGRLSLTELEKLIDVDRVYVEKQVVALARSRNHHSDAYYVVNNGEEVVTNWYLDAIMEDTNTELQESGTTTIGELAQQYGFDVEYMKEVVRVRLGGILKAREKLNVLYTESYVAAQRAQLRGIFAAVTRPIFVPDVLRKHRFDEAVAQEALQELLRSQVLLGVLRGREYVPLVFLEAQRENMYSFFQQNGYLEHSRALELQVTRPFDFLRRRFPDAVALKESVVSRELQLQVEGAVEAVATDGGFVDVQTLVPSALGVVDIGLLLTMSAALEKTSPGAPKAFRIGESFIVSGTFLDACMDKFKADAAVKAKQAATQKSSGPVVSHETIQEEEEDEDVGGKRGKKARRAKSGGKARKGKRTTKRGDDEESSGGSTVQQPIAPTPEEIAAMLVKWFPTVDEAQGDDEFMDGLVSHLEAKVGVVYAEALAKSMSTVLRGDAASLRELRKTFEDKFDEQLAKLLVLEKGFNKLAMHVDAKDASGMEALAAVETHLLETSAVELAALTTSFVAEANSLDDLEGVPRLSAKEEEKAETAEATSLTALSDENKKVLETNLPASTASALVRLWTLATAGRRSLSDFTAHIPVLADALGMPLRKQDRKKERQTTFGHRMAVLAELEDAVKETNSYAVVAALVFQLFFQQCTGLPASFPRGSVEYADMILKAFGSSVPEKPMESLQAFAALARELSASEEADDDKQEAWTQSLETTRALVLLKDLSAAE